MIPFISLMAMYHIYITWNCYQLFMFIIAKPKNGKIIVNPDYNQNADNTEFWCTHYCIQSFGLYMNGSLLSIIINLHKAPDRSFFQHAHIHQSSAYINSISSPSIVLNKMATIWWNSSLPRICSANILFWSTWCEECGHTPLDLPPYLMYSSIPKDVERQLG